MNSNEKRMTELRRLRAVLVFAPAAGIVGLEGTGSENQAPAAAAGESPGEEGVVRGLWYRTYEEGLVDGAEVAESRSTLVPMVEGEE